MREIFEQQEQLLSERHETTSAGKKNHVDLKLPMAYYGYRDEEELDLLQLEADAEAVLIDSSVTKWNHTRVSSSS